MPITTVQQLRDAIQRADIPDNIRAIALQWLDSDPNPPAEIDDNALRAWFWFGPIQLRQYASAILDAGGQTNRSRVIRLRVTESEHAAITAAAEEAGMSVSQYLRKCAQRDKEQEG